MANRQRELDLAFDAAIAEAEKCLRVGMSTANGASAAPFLEQLVGELRRERDRAVDGTVDRERFRQTIRSLVDWLPDNELTLIAALGRIVRAIPAPRS